MIDSTDILFIGSLVRTHGKQGEIQCRTTNSYWEDADADFIILMLDAIPVPFRVKDWRCKGEDILFSLSGVDTEEQALRLIGSEVYMLRKDIATDDAETILCWGDLIGYRIISPNRPIVTIKDIDDSTSNVLAALDDGRLIPLHEDFITAIDHEARTLTMTLPEGL